jgi:hypothetical protein
VSYTTYGWFVTASVGAFLVPITIINFTTIFLIVGGFLIFPGVAHNDQSENLVFIKLLRLTNAKHGPVRLDDPNSWNDVLVSGDRTKNP